MLTIEEVRDLTKGKGIRIGKPVSDFHYDALVVRDAVSTHDHLRLVDEYGRLIRPYFKNYGKTWYVESVY